METNKNFTTTTEDGKAASIVSYFGILWLVAYFAMYKDKKTDLSTYQLRQSLLINILYVIVGIAGNIVLRIIPSVALGYVFSALYLVLFIIWIIGLIGAIQGQKKPMPLIGEKAQTMFPNI
ncbi:hypothetical protein EZ449_06440 [Pedobacter frigidisoli]|uniref:Import component protein n=1 Tax=Pedobacter frigidisoli TaxID=2530455 RepID=A0A4R0P3G5_9SPHI|nr:hypothetical protein [Pedobacter frigidisoli]TCD11129.1 hypothetical protein EZ449_06440 [Pedobacter frigidisoli]